MSSGWAQSALEWWSDAGVDVIVGETPCDWLNPAASRSVAAEPLTPTPSPDLPDNLPDFHAWLAMESDLPGAAPSAPRLDPGGTCAPPVMILTDFPALEDFVAGKLLSSDGLFDKMLGAIGLSRETIYLASLSPFRPASGQVPAAAVRRCVEIARHHIGLVGPKAVLLLGDVCAKGFTGGAVNQSRSRWHEITTKSGPVKALVTLKPEQLNRQPNLKSLAWADLQMLAKEIKE